jgi:hypothetical protein
VKNASLAHADDRAQRLHRLRRVVAWVALVVLGLGLTGVLAAATRDTNAQGRTLVTGGVSFEALQALGRHTVEATFNGQTQRW